MAAGLQNQEGVPDNQLKKRLAAAVRSVQWSYAIFWSLSTTQQGVLEWGAGYYNGDIKTRKTVQHMELNAAQLGLQRSEQLRELYESLSAGDNNQQSKRPSAALSPEDLTDAEWYYLNAPNADSKVFTRSLLAKTVVCFPLMGGVVELGVTELIPEDLSILQTVKTAFLEFSKFICADQSTSSPEKPDKDEDLTCTELDHDGVNKSPLEKLNPPVECEILSEGIRPGGPESFPLSHPVLAQQEEMEHNCERIEEQKTGSSDDSSNGCCPNQHTDDSFMLDGLNGTASQVQSWQFMDDDFSTGLHGSVNSSDCISRCHVVNPEKAITPPKGVNGNSLIRDIQECNHVKFGLLGLDMEDSHYARTLTAIFGNSKHLVSKPFYHNGNCGSSFIAWRKGADAQKPLVSGSQKILKKILFDVAWMHGVCSPKSPGDPGCKGRAWKLETGGVNVNNVLLERGRREKLNEKFMVLKSLVPSISKIDKASILGDAIEYLKELERRVEELEACKESSETGARERRKHPDIVERTSDNYGNNEIANGKKPSINKRKACDIDEVADVELNWVLTKDCLADMTVTIIEKEVVIEMRCPWRECMLMEIVEAISGLHLDAYSVQSCTNDGVLALSLKSKLRGGSAVSAGMIKQTLQKVVSKC
ncbi:endoglucanase 3 [Asimina triloba]